MEPWWNPRRTLVEPSWKPWWDPLEPYLNHPAALMEAGGTLVEPWWNLTSGPPRTTPEPIWAETPKLSAVWGKPYKIINFSTRCPICPTHPHLQVWLFKRRLCSEAWNLGSDTYWPKMWLPRPQTVNFFGLRPPANAKPRGDSLAFSQRSVWRNKSPPNLWENRL